LFSDEPRRSVRATKGQHTKSLDILDQPIEPTKKRAKKTATKKALDEEEEEKETEETIRCICGATSDDDDSGESWIACQECSAWQHNVCMGITTDKKIVDHPDYEYWCEQCKPENHKELLDGIARGEKPWEQRRQAYEEAELAAQKGKKGKKGKGKRISDPKLETVANSKTNEPNSSLEVNIEKEKEKEKTEAVGRSGSTKRKNREEQPEDSTKVRVNLCPLIVGQER
jgi:hypothetical protein